MRRDRGWVCPFHGDCDGPTCRECQDSDDVGIVKMLEDAENEVKD